MVVLVYFLNKYFDKKCPQKNEGARAAQRLGMAVCFFRVRIFAVWKIVDDDWRWIRLSSRDVLLVKVLISALTRLIYGLLLF